MITAALVSAKGKTDGTRKVSATPAFRCYVLLNVIKRQQTEQLCNLRIARENVWNSLSFPNTMVVWMMFALTDSYILILGPQLVELWLVGTALLENVCQLVWTLRFQKSTSVHVLFLCHVWRSRSKLSATAVGPCLLACFWATCYYGNRFTLWNSKSLPKLFYKLF